MENFRKLKLSENLLRAIRDSRFEKPSEIQEKTIPLVLEGKDVLGSSATGSGKTLAFGVGIIQNVKRGEGVQALVLTPTRELADQVTKSLRIFSKYYNLQITEVFGGVGIEPQIRGIARAEVVVGTPGRILDHLSRRTLDLSGLRFLVLDEADRMFDMGFIHDVEKIIKICPKDRQTLLFSATISSDVERLSRKYMISPVSVEAVSYVDASKLKQIYYDVPQNKKFSLLVYLLKREHQGLIMVFCKTRINVDLVTKNLIRQGLHALAIHGGLTQSRRNSVMRSFHANETFILVCTDVAARGLDIKNVSHIYNYDLPGNSVDYIHRIGRTARAGKEGIAISLVTQRDYENLRNVRKDDSLIINSENLPEGIEDLAVNFSVERSAGRFRRSGNNFHGGRNFSSRNSRGRDGSDGGNQRRFNRNYGRRDSIRQREKRNSFRRSESKRWR